MPGIKDALDSNKKLTVAERELLKSHLVCPSLAGSMDMQCFVTEERFVNGRVCTHCACAMLFATEPERTERRGICVFWAINQLNLVIRP